MFGSGSWGTAFSVVLADAGNDVTLWARRQELSTAINQTRQNRDYLPGIVLPEQVVATTMRSLDQPDGPASVVSGRRNGITAKLVALLPRRLALQISGRALRAERA